MTMKPKKPLTKEEALLTMAGLCARSEQCAGDIARKLAARGLAPGDVAFVIEELERRGFIDLRRFAAAFARDKVRFSAWGRRKISASLAAKRIPSSIVSETLAQIPADDYAEAVSRAARAKASALNLEVYADCVKLYRHLLSRGFESEIASGQIRKLRGK